MTVVSARPRVMRYLSIALALVIAQTAVLGWMIESRASLLRSGEEVVLMKDRSGRVIGFEKLNFTSADSPLDVGFEAVEA